MHDSTYAFPVTEIGHLLAMAVFGGAIILVDLRLLDLGFTKQPTAQIARELLPLTLGGVIAMFISGGLLFMGGTLRYYHNPVFRIKVVLFFIALLFHFILQIKVARQTPEPGQNPGWLRAGAVVSLLLWFSVGLAGRAVGYV